MPAIVIPIRAAALAGRGEEPAALRFAQEVFAWFAVLSLAALPWAALALAAKFAIWLVTR